MGLTIRVLRATAPPAEQAFMDGMVDAFQPVTARFDGMQNEGAAITCAAFSLPVSPE